MWSNHLKVTINCLLVLSAITIASVRAQQRYNTYNNQYARQQLVYEYHPTPQKTPPQQYLASAPALPAQASFPPVQAPAPLSQAPFPSAQAPFPLVRAPAPITQAQAPINLNARQSQDLITQIVDGSEQFTFDMIYVS